MDDLPARGSADGSELLVKTKVFDMDNNIAAALSYVPLCLANVIFSIIWFASEPKSNRYLRHHAIQSLTLTIAYAVVSIALFVTTAILSMIPFIGFLGLITSLLNGLVGLSFFVGNFYLMYCAYKGKNVSIPLISDYADKFEN